MPWGVSQENWRWYQDNAPEPTSALAAENVRPTLANNTDKIRLRVTVRSILGGGTLSNLYLEWSQDQVNWFAFGASQHWNYANGQATEGNATTTYKLSDSNDHGKYHESATISETWAMDGIWKEMDWCIVPTAYVEGG